MVREWPRNSATTAPSTVTRTSVMPLRPSRNRSAATASIRSPSSTGRRKLTLHWLATEAMPFVLQAKAKALSASAKMKPPWQEPWPFSMRSCTTMDMRAVPGPTCSSTMPSPALAWSPFHRVVAQAWAS